MSEALLSRLISSELYRPDEICVSEPRSKRREELSQTYGVSVTPDNRMVMTAEVILLAIKPQVFDQVAVAVEDCRTTALVLSILAGVPLSRLEAAFPNCPVVRTMPNTPAIVGAGMTALSPGHLAQSHHLERAKRIFQSVGDVVQVPEHLMDAVTGLSGSGPGYIALVLESLTDGGVAAGLPRPVAAQLAVQTVSGTAQLVRDADLHPAVLKDRVTSPGGTTIVGIAHLEQAGVRSAFLEAVKAACRRSQELGQG